MRSRAQAQARHGRVRRLGGTSGRTMIEIGVQPMPPTLPVPPDGKPLSAQRPSRTAVFSVGVLYLRYSSRKAKSGHGPARVVGSLRGRAIQTARWQQHHSIPARVERVHKEGIREGRTKGSRSHPCG